MMASVSSGEIARLTGGPAMVLGSGRLAMMRGASGSVPMSMMDRESRPGADSTTLPVASQDCFSSLATIISSRLPGLAMGAAQPVAASTAAVSRDRHRDLCSRG